MSTTVAFEKARAEGRAALIGYLPAGYPTVDGSIAALKAMVEAGVDAVEIGLPYSDPVIDGPTVQAAVEAALKAGTTTADVLRVVEAVAATGAPAVVMSYWNPLQRYGAAAFARDLAAAGGSGVITPDLTPDADDSWIPAAREHGLDTVFLVAPSSTDERIAMTTAACRGFVYATSVMGVTGTREQVGDAASGLVARTKATTELPVAVGLGVSNAAQAAEIAAFADGVVVGSAFVRRMLDAPDPASGAASIAELAADLARGVRER
ncbi:tryptophan synthase subunit alpha [Jiangella alkaliphila]|uniref:Tryptophan synthase alpha chain n=1 Tax=Jiangella alkaliphila TaxID=419479 RepID=A0A1H2L512_9ACTN|nr:tryptophan synthase subunit alpha [Jiangella alkaliphila]SDU75576.1 tryptophan synthase, alpha chain [Jiangella alkaliphila]